MAHGGSCLRRGTRAVPSLPGESPETPSYASLGQRHIVHPVRRGPRWGDHALACCGGGDRVLRHKAVGDVLCTAVSQCTSVAPELEKPRPSPPTTPSRSGVAPVWTASLCRTLRAGAAPTDIWVPRGTSSTPEAWDVGRSSDLRPSSFASADPRPEDVFTAVEAPKRSLSARPWLGTRVFSFGATRGNLAEGNGKSSARLLCPPERRREFQVWDTECVRRTAQVLNPDDNISALGASFGSLDHTNAQVRQAVESSSELRQAILSVDHAPTEVVLTRQCADVSKLTNHLRLGGDGVDHPLPVMFDSQLRSAVSASPSGDFPNHSWWQGHHWSLVRWSRFPHGRVRGFHPPAQLSCTAAAAVESDSTATRIGTLC